MNNDLLKSPGGMRSLLPDMAMELRDIQERIEEVFLLWGYQPVITPTLEYYDSLTIGMGKRMDQGLYKLIDYEGNILALRPEMTAPIARTIAGRLTDIQLPARYSYNAPVFRYDEPQTGRNREIYQMGVEFIGRAGLAADAEALILAIESIQNTGIKDFKLDIGHAAYLEGIIGQLKLKEEQKREIRGYLTRKDIVGLQNYLDIPGLESAEVLTRLPLLRGNKEVLKLAREMVDNQHSLKAVSELEEVYHFIADYGLEGYLNFDPGLIRGFDYYTGIVFEGFTEKLGYTICGGGRYDNLIACYSEHRIPAVGFAIGMERIRLALRRQEHHFALSVPENLLVFNRRQRIFALKLAKKLREKGEITITVENEEFDREIISLAKNKGLKKVFNCTFDEESIEIIKPGINSKTLLKIKKGWEEKIWDS
ncbi:MAG TPA: ATP phosphoribosyltransferase regulatory subunit [Halanaerobiales bacterium]|nr:ATP phosphoribosyltransferase regulatory subunit [Halanaerobiales bacterium]